MKRFHFGLQTILDWRDRQAERERSLLEGLHAERNKLERECRQLEEQIADSHASCARGDSGSGEDLWRIAGYLDGLKTREARVRQNAAQCRVGICEQTNRCVKADRDHQLLARLRDRRLADWKYELNRETETGASDSWLAGYAREAVRSRSDRGD